MSNSDGRIGDTEGEFSVCQFFPDGMYEYTRRWVSIEEAVKAFNHYTTNVASRIGVTQRVIITDGGDSTVMEWVKDQGVIFPTKEQFEAARAIRDTSR